MKCKDRSIKSKKKKKMAQKHVPTVLATWVGGLKQEAFEINIEFGSGDCVRNIMSGI